MDGRKYAGGCRSQDVEDEWMGGCELASGNGLEWAFGEWVDYIRSINRSNKGIDEWLDGARVDIRAKDWKEKQQHA